MDKVNKIKLSKGELHQFDNLKIGLLIVGARRNMPLSESVPDQVFFWNHWIKYIFKNKVIFLII